MSNARVIYTSRPDATPEAELSALTAVYKFVLAKKEGRLPDKSGPDDAKGSQHDRANTSIPKQ